MSTIANTPPKGTYDWRPEEFRVRKYIFDKWREVVTRFGYEEYLTPLFESADIYRAKSGEDIGGKELMTFTDKAGREYALRPEMTPSVTRMVTRFYDAVPKPIRLFSVANFVRNEKPQRGRNREFWQLNLDIFGTSSLNADIEIAQITAEIMLAFNPPTGSFTVFLNNRKLIDYCLTELAGITGESKQAVVRILDKSEKLQTEELDARLNELGLSPKQVELLKKFISSSDENALEANIPEITKSEGFQEIKEVLKAVEDMGYKDLFVFKPNVIRGFDYYDGIVFEVFDNSPENTRSLFGGGRYNGLAQIFGKQDIPAVGIAPGDETLRIFLESWGLVEQALAASPGRYYAPILDTGLITERDAISKKLRGEGKVVIDGLDEQKFGKALEFANKTGVDYVVIFGGNEKAQGIYKIKNMKTGEEAEYNFKTIG